MKDRPACGPVFLPVWTPPYLSPPSSSIAAPVPEPSSPAYQERQVLPSLRLPTAAAPFTHIRNSAWWLGASSSNATAIIHWASAFPASAIGLRITNFAHMKDRWTDLLDRPHPDFRRRASPDTFQ